MSNVLIIEASHRAKGNSQDIADLVASLAVEAGRSVETINLRKLKFHYCIACEACATTGKCVLQDEMQGAYQKLHDAEIIVVAAPIYFQTVGGLLKNFLDRCQCLYSIHYLMKENFVKDDTLRSKRKLLPIFVGGTMLEDTFPCAENTMRVWGIDLNCQKQAAICLGKVDSRGDFLADQVKVAEVRERVEKLFA
ncbi:MAG: flavodoxin family protein [Clostridia bacterium]